MGRPLLTIPDRDLDRVRAGELTIAGLARKLGVAPRTIRRRLRGSHWRVRAKDTQL
jgi:IS30 family transposase